jgi:SAM-dependent methyltransferase
MQTDPAAYDDFAWIYDRHWGRDTLRSMDTLRALVLGDHPAPRRVLDLCCGTGQLDHALHQAGYAVTGVDGSPEMIGHARRNAPGGEFIVADARAFSVPEPCDLALCMYDSLEPPDVALIAALTRPLRAERSRGPGARRRAWRSRQ